MSLYWSSGHEEHALDLISSYGAPGRRVYVDGVNGSDGNAGNRANNAFRTMAAGYAQLRANRNDILYVIGGASAYAMTAITTWSKDYCHIIGLAAPINTGGRVRFTNTVTTATTGEFVISATGCIFQNLHIQYGDSATGTSVIGTSITGGRNYFKNCSFEGPIDATIGAAAYRVVNVGTGVQDLTFDDCHFGERTIQCTGATGAIVHFAGANNTNFVFNRCIFNAYNTNTASATISFVNNAMPDSGWCLFRKCSFINFANVNVADVIRFATGEHGIVTLDQCSLSGLGTLVWATNRKSTIFSTGAAGSATGGVGANPA